MTPRQLTAETVSCKELPSGTARATCLSEAESSYFREGWCLTRQLSALPLLALQIFLTKEHSKAESGHESPGPVYELKSSVGKQMSSKNESPPAFSFGTSDRFEKLSAAKMREVAPGPGQYKKPGCYGNQVCVRACGVVPTHVVATLNACGLLPAPAISRDREPPSIQREPLFC